MYQESRWLEVGIGVLAIIGLLAVFVAGILGIRALLNVRGTGGPSDGIAGIGVPPPPAPPPPPAEAPPPPVGAMPPPAIIAGPPRTTVYPQSGYRAVPGGTPDLSVQIIDTGILVGGEGGEFRHTDAVGPNEFPALVFDIMNAGTAVSESWEFSATLPTFAGFFSSETQARLAPGDRIRFTLGFRPLNRAGPTTAVITIDPTNRLRDARRANDVATTTFTRIP